MSEYSIYNNLEGGSSIKQIPFQLIPFSKKKGAWLEAHNDFFYTEAKKQLNRNIVFSDIRKMTEGEYTYRAVDIEQTLLGTSHEGAYKRLASDVAISTHLKHFDFLGIISNSIIATFGTLDDLYRIEATDEYTTNEYIRDRTRLFEERGKAIINLEINKLLLKKGINPNQEEFQSEEEQQQYVQMLEAEVAKLTPKEIEKELQKNFKVIAVDWANNVITNDKKKFTLDREDKKALTDYILTGRWFRHFKMGYDYYTIEYWKPEEVFFAQTPDIEYPQDSEYVGRLTEMSLSDALVRYGHLMTTKQQEEVGNFWGQDKDFKTGVNPSGTEPFATEYIVPFKNYFDHQVNVKMEDAIGAPLAQTMDENGDVTRHYMPRAEFGRFGLNSKRLRTDIDVDNSLLEVMEVYWRSMKRIGVLIYRNEVGAIAVKTTTEELIKDFVIENEIKIKKTLSLEELQTALREGNIEDHVNTLTYHHIPEVWNMVVIKGKNSLIVKDDMILGARPILQQIKGDSNLFHVKIPVGGLISKSPITKAFPYQQLHNICMNQNTELLADEPGIFYSLDINALPAEYKDEDTQEALYNTLDTIRMTKLLPMDLSRVNTQGSTVYPNIFQRNEIVFRDQVLYRKEMAEYYRSEGLRQLGITPQMLGEPTKYTTAEGVNVQKTASYALMSNIIDEFNTSKAKVNELHIAVAQICEVNGKVSNRLIKNSDGANAFIDILAEDPDYFPLRKLNVFPASSSRDRAIVEAIKGMLLADNTIQKDFESLVDIFTNPNIIEMKQIAKDMRLLQQKNTEDQRAFESEQLDKQLKATKEANEDKQAHEKELLTIKGEFDLQEQYIQALGRDSASTKEDNFADLTTAYKTTIQENKNNSDILIKTREIERKEKADLNAKEKAKQDFLLKTQEFNLRKQISQNSLQESIINKN